MANKQGSLGDRFAEITVVLVTLVALIFGGMYKSSVENASIPFEAQGVSLAAPKGWIQASVRGNEIFRASDFNSSGFATTYSVQKIAVADDATAPEVANFILMDRAQTLDAFKALDQNEVSDSLGRDAYLLHYVYVSSNPDATHASIPNIVRGADFIYLKGGYAYVVSFQADDQNYDRDLGRFYRFLESLQF
ncbi:MAG: hypothetical protein LC099_03385 [Anaerolineales bacterium]|nr:hypothetical protein [Anaerolineales bacterium]